MNLRVCGWQLRRTIAHILGNVVGTFVIAVVLVTGASGQRQYTVTDLGTLGGSWTSALAINSVGQITGGSYTAGDNESHAFLWTSGTMADIGPMGWDSIGTALNGSGHVVGYMEASLQPEQAFLFINNQVVPLGTMGHATSFAYAISDSGKVLFNAQTEEGADRRGESFLYDSALGNANSLTLATGYDIWPYAMNKSGQMTGLYWPNGFTYGQHAFIYTAGTLTEIGGLGAVNNWSDAAAGMAINDKGDVVGYYVTLKQVNDNVYQITHAFLYIGGKTFDLGGFGGNSTAAFAINNSGEIVGASRLVSGDNHAFLYTPKEKMIDLNKFMPKKSGWTLTDARGINDAGQIIANAISQTGVTHAFLLTPKKVPPRK